ncbi:methionine--tRNA ligase [Haloferax mediterranei ATCC 33500]|uniref:Methionine--tRNA ligase n=1 Tax=Haloferax mediterranei (strain ATCC 33500 / DSM 1411 / JCM 8866 / NBRC 14739 / NCIMB 2177 / R-4) TaxID=523841 RepID=I3R2P1_HALMT|nr:methionine--tRNA ligase [Haloferax mediterranei]AFK18501.2 methionyl-tRNA synthetase [Haloferax mediterranei ATCC 33500]AHZ22119.1 methionyl-tRNA synthetase [Haloferax mediterranei ATCC 33500]EMA02226.1 methionyl-tRNA ligase [Haloferax mediterranei ATCC 33500]MDX5988589.1 methionine--tRNA ligase [Haloferax mediterranei ATCC 33500]QCQ75005.1 methionine--tRNA ligase [Haloferax mediterranei ATCC 33500]
MSHEDFPTENPAVVTCGLPYANGDLHIGHLRTYVGGDIYSRSLRTLGQQTAFVSGSDMHGTPVAVNAEKEGVTPEEFALRHHEKYEATFPRFNIEFDNYGHTHDETNTELTQEIVKTLEAEGYVYEKVIQVAYDPDADQWLPDRFVEGTCPYCGEHARGDECDEGCGRHLEPGEIENPTSVRTGNPAEYREREHKFFAVSDLQEYLQEFIDRLEGTSNAQNQPREWIEGELQDWCITRDMDWGIDYPDGDEEDFVLYVWVDAPIEYISSTKQYTARVGADTFDWEQAWRENGDIVHIIGRDIIQHHTVFWPAMLRAADYAEPRAVMASGFITLNGKGFSTSRNRAVWADEYLDEGFHPDLLRYYLATNGGFQQDVDFSWSKFRERVNSELVGTVGNFLYRSMLFAYRNFEGTPETDTSEEVETRIEEAVEEFEAGINDYSIRESGNAVVRLAQFGNEYIQRNEPWQLTDEDPERAAQVIRDCVQIAKAISVLFYPVVPGKMQALWEQLGEDGAVADVGVDAAFEAPADTFGEPEALFEKIEAERVEELNEKLEARVAATESESESEESEEDADESMEDSDLEFEPIADDRISFEEFQNLDLRVGEIVAAEGIDGADKLAKLTVDIGVEERQIVAGIKQLHDLESLPGTKAIIVANLEKAELFGTESNGMLLAAGDEADILTTHGDAVPGTKVQ